MMLFTITGASLGMSCLQCAVMWVVKPVVQGKVVSKSPINGSLTVK